MILKTICLGLALSFALTAQGEEATAVDEAAPKPDCPLKNSGFLPKRLIASRKPMSKKSMTRPCWKTLSEDS